MQIQKEFLTSQSFVTKICELTSLQKAHLGHWDFSALPSVYYEEGIKASPLKAQCKLLLQFSKIIPALELISTTGFFEPTNFITIFKIKSNGCLMKIQCCFSVLIQYKVFCQVLLSFLIVSFVSWGPSSL